MPSRQQATSSRGSQPGSLRGTRKTFFAKAEDLYARQWATSSRGSQPGCLRGNRKSLAALSARANSRSLHTHCRSLRYAGVYIPRPSPRTVLQRAACQQTQTYMISTHMRTQRTCMNSHPKPTRLLVISIGIQQATHDVPMGCVSAVRVIANNPVL